MWEHKVRRMKAAVALSDAVSACGFGVSAGRITPVARECLGGLFSGAPGAEDVDVWRRGGCTWGKLDSRNVLSVIAGRYSLLLPDGVRAGKAEFQGGCGSGGSSCSLDVRQELCTNTMTTIPGMEDYLSDRALPSVLSYTRAVRSLSAPHLSSPQHTTHNAQHGRSRLHERQVRRRN